VKWSPWSREGAYMWNTFAGSPVDLP